MPSRPPDSFLDRPAARLLALLVVLLCLALLGYIHREDLLATGGAEDDPFALCFADRADDIARMREEGVIDDDRAALFRSRAEAFCRAQAEQGGEGAPGTSSLPGQ